MERTDLTSQGNCEIKIKGKLEAKWKEWFEPLKLVTESDATIVSGTVTDQPELQGLIQKISMLGLTVISIKFDTDSSGGK